MDVLETPLQRSVYDAIDIVDFEVDGAHKKIMGILMKDFAHGDNSAMTENVTKAAWIRRFLG